MDPDVFDAYDNTLQNTFDEEPDLIILGRCRTRYNNDDGYTNVNISRPNALGNPFFMEDENKRGAVIKAYKFWLHKKCSLKEAADKYDVPFDRKYLSKKLEARNRIRELVEGVKAGERYRLLCWCDPKPCHGSVIISQVMKMAG